MSVCKAYICIKEGNLTKNYICPNPIKLRKGLAFLHKINKIKVQSYMNKTRKL